MRNSKVRKKYEYTYIQRKCSECEPGGCVDCRIADVPASALFALIFPSQLTQFNSCKTRVQLWENLCPLCAPISSVHIRVQIPAWIMQLPPTWTLLIPVCLTAVEMAPSTAWILNGVVTLISKWTRSTCCSHKNRFYSILISVFPSWWTKAVQSLQEEQRGCVQLDI